MRSFRTFCLVALVVAVGCAVQYPDHPKEPSRLRAAPTVKAEFHHDLPRNESRADAGAHSALSPIGVEVGRIDAAKVADPADGSASTGTTTNSSAAPDAANESRLSNPSGASPYLDVSEMSEPRGEIKTYVENGQIMVPDCQGKYAAIVAPRWLVNIPFWAALCVDASKRRKPLNVDVGASLIAQPGLGNATSAVGYQVYYALNQVVVDAGKKQVVWAVCGGGGEWLYNGTRVVPSFRLPSKTVKLLSEQVAALVAMADEWAFFADLLKQPSSARSRVELQKRLDIIDVSLMDAGGLLRGALILEARQVLLNAGRLSGPLW